MTTKCIMLLCFACFTALDAAAQFRSIILKTQASQLKKPSEIAIAINLKDKDNIVAIGALNNLFVSHNGGETWIEKQIENYTNPELFSDRKGDFYFSYQPGGKVDPAPRMLFQKSSDEGESWSGKINAIENVYGQHATVADPNAGRMYATWIGYKKRREDNMCPGEVYFSENNGGKNWSDPALIHSSSINCVDTAMQLYAPMSAVGPDGELFVVWANERKVYMDRSLNNGKNWLRTNFEVLEFVNGSGKTYRNKPYLICDNSDSQYRGMLYLNWVDQRKEKDGTSIWFKRSANFGDTWNSPVKVTNGVSRKHEYAPAMTVDNSSGLIYIVYYNQGTSEDKKTDVYLAYSQDGGASFTNKVISESPFSPDEPFSGNLDIAAHEGRVVAIWTRSENGEHAIVTTVIDESELLTPDERNTKKRARK